MLPATENQRAWKHAFFKGGKIALRMIAFKRYHTVDVEYERWLDFSLSFFPPIFPTLGAIY